MGCISRRPPRRGRLLPEGSARAIETLLQVVSESQLLHKTSTSESQLPHKTVSDPSAWDECVDHLLSRILKWFRGGPLSKAHRLLYHSTPGSRVDRKKEEGWCVGSPAAVQRIGHTSEARFIRWLPGQIHTLAFR